MNSNFINFFKFRLIINIINKKFFPPLYLFSLTLFALYKFYSSEYFYLPEHDEIATISTFTDLRTIFLKYIPNNHSLSSLIGVFILNFTDLEIYKLRLISFIFFLFTLVLIKKNISDDIFIYFIFLLFFVFSYLSSYSFLHRGYSISSFLFVLTFFLLKKFNYEHKQSILIYLIILICLIHSMSTILLAISILLFVTYENLKRKNFNILFLVSSFYFLILSPIIIFTGLYLNKLFVLKIDYNYFKIYLDGFTTFFFPLAADSNIILQFTAYLEKIDNNFILLIVLLITFLTCLINNFKKKTKILDKVILLFFIILFLVPKAIPERVYMNFFIFFLLYLFFEFKDFIYKFFNKDLAKLLVIIFTIISLNKFHLYEKLDEVIFYPEKKIINCELTLSSKNEFDYHLYYYSYLANCKAKPDVIEFYEFYKTRPVEKDLKNFFK